MGVWAGRVTGEPLLLAMPRLQAKGELMNDLSRLIMENWKLISFGFYVVVAIWICLRYGR